MRNLVLLCACAVLLVSSGNETPSQASRLYRPLGARQEDLVRWRELAALPSAQKRIAEAEAYFGQPIPECPDAWYLDFTRNGNRSRYEQPYFARLTALQDLVLVEALERKGRFRDEIARWLDAILGERTWVMPAHDRDLKAFSDGHPRIDLGSTHRTAAVACSVGLLGESLPPDLVARAKDELKRRTLDSYLWTLRNRTNNPYFGSWHARSNWNAVCNGGLTIAVLMVEDDPSVREEVLRGWLEAMRFYLEGFTSDGYCSEGIGYWNYGFGEFLAAALYVKRTTDGRVDAFQLPRAREAMAYGYGFQLQHLRSPQFADGSGDPAPRLLALGELAWPDLASTDGRKTDRLSGSLTTILARNFGGAQATPTACADGSLPLDTLPPRTWFPEAQVLIARAPLPVPFAVAIKGGHNAEQHNHNDVGSYSIMLDGMLMAGDPGNERYTARTFSKDRYLSPVLSSYGHPVPVVGGARQGTGRAYSAKTRETDFSEARDRLVLDLTSAYAVSNLVSLVRTVDFNRVARTVAITDEVTFAEPSSFASPLVTYADVVADYAKGRYTLVAQGRKLQATASSDDAPWHLTSELLDNPTKTSPKRLALVFDSPVTSARVSWTFSPEPR